LPFALVRPPANYALETTADTDANIVTALDVSDSILATRSGSSSAG
jgi:hypothetical protein